MVGAKSKFSLHDSQDASTIQPVWFLLRYQVDLKNQPGVPFNRRPLLQRLQRPDVQHRGCSIMFHHSTWTPVYHWWVQMVQAFGTKVTIEEPLCRCFWRWCCRPAVTNCRSWTNNPCLWQSWFLGWRASFFWFLCSKMHLTFVFAGLYWAVLTLWIGLSLAFFGDRRGQRHVSCPFKQCGIGWAENSKYSPTVGTFLPFLEWRYSWKPGNQSSYIMVTCKAPTTQWWWAVICQTVSREPSTSSACQACPNSLSSVCDWDI